MAYGSKLLDQFLLLVAGIGMSACLFWAWRFMEYHSISDRAGFFILYNVLSGLVLTWQGVALFRRTPGFWQFHLLWCAIHVCVYGAWYYSGNRVELCAFTLPFEGYLYYRTEKARFLRSSGTGEQRV